MGSNAPAGPTGPAFLRTPPAKHDALVVHPVRATTVGLLDCLVAP